MLSSTFTSSKNIARVVTAELEPHNIPRADSAHWLDYGAIDWVHDHR
jgi:hypothetical protein